MRFSNEITFHLEKMTIGESNNCVTLDPSEARPINFDKGWMRTAE